ncbi:hypothetical protein M3J07_008737 [Ascochyta lentis]
MCELLREGRCCFCTRSSRILHNHSYTDALGLSTKARGSFPMYSRAIDVWFVIRSGFTGLAVLTTALNIKFTNIDANNYDTAERERPRTQGYAKPI